MEEINNQQTKIWLCSMCKSAFNTRWLLVRHLKDVHHIDKREADIEARLCEWWRVYNPKLGQINREIK